jgi:hypothetical protein
MLLRKLIAVTAAGLLGVTLAQDGAVARGGAGFHGFGPIFGRGSRDGYTHTYFGRGFTHAERRDAHDGRHWAMHGFGGWEHGVHGHGGRFEPGHWRLSSGFGDRGHRLYAEGVWHR